MIRPIPEREAIMRIQKETWGFFGWDYVLYAQENDLFPQSGIQQAELSPTNRCPEDCHGCPDAVSNTIEKIRKGIIPRTEPRIGLEKWKTIIKQLLAFRVRYFLLIGGTIDHLKITHELLKYLTELKDQLDWNFGIGWFTDGIPLLDKTTMEPNGLFSDLFTKANIGKVTTHISVDFLADPKNPYAKTDSRYYKSIFGLSLAQELIHRDVFRIVINTTLFPNNLGHIIPIYEYVCRLQDMATKLGRQTRVLHSISPWTWRPGLARGDNPGIYDPSKILTNEQYNELVQICKYIDDSTIYQIQNGEIRIIANSSGFIRGLPVFAITQDVPYPRAESHTLAVEPNGTVRMDPVFPDARM